NFGGTPTDRQARSFRLPSPDIEHCSPTGEPSPDEWGRTARTTWSQSSKRHDPDGADRPQFACASTPYRHMDRMPWFRQRQCAAVSLSRSPITGRDAVERTKLDPHSLDRRWNSGMAQGLEFPRSLVLVHRIQVVGVSGMAA